MNSKAKTVKFHVSYTRYSPYWDEPDSEIKTEEIEVKYGTGEINSGVIREVLTKKLGIRPKDRSQISKIIAFSRIYET